VQIYTLQQRSKLDVLTVWPEQTKQRERVWQWQRMVVKPCNNVISYEFLWIRSTCDYSWVLTTACCLTIGLELGLDLVSGWLLVMHMYLHSFPLSLSTSLLNKAFFQSNVTKRTNRHTNIPLSEINFFRISLFFYCFWHACASPSRYKTW